MSRKKVELDPPPVTMSYKELMEAGRTFTATEYATYMGTAMPTAKKELTTLVFDGKAEIIAKRGQTIWYKLKPPLLDASNPFKLDRKNAAEQPEGWTLNKWMEGANISGGQNEI